MGNPVVHFDISGPNPQELQDFYGSLFGWKIDPVPDMDYALVDTQGGHGLLGGIGKAVDGAGQVTFYAWSEDLQATLDKAESLGAKTTQTPMEIPGTVRLAMFADPAGNPIGLVGSLPEMEGQEAPPPTDAGGAAVSWFEVMGPDAGALTTFYTELFGWTASKYDLPGEMEYAELDPGDPKSIHGGVGSNPMATSYVTVYAESPDLAATIAKAEELGGKTLMPPTEMPGGPSVAMFADPQGHIFGLYKPGRAAQT